MLAGNAEWRFPDGWRPWELFRLAGRGTAVVGRIEPGVLESGRTVEILDGGKLVATARAVVEMITSRQADRGTR